MSQNKGEKNIILTKENKIEMVWMCEERKMDKRTRYKVRSDGPGCVGVSGIGGAGGGSGGVIVLVLMLEVVVIGMVLVLVVVLSGQPTGSTVE